MKVEGVSYIFNRSWSRIPRSGFSPDINNYLKDHLGTNRMTVRGDSIVVADDFSGTLSQWTTVLGRGFNIQNGELADSSAGADNVLVNSNTQTLADGIVGVDVRTLSGDFTDGSLIFRYQDVNNYYMASAYDGQILLYKKSAGIYSQVASVVISPHFTGGFYRLQVTAVGGAFTVYWKGQQVLSWTDPSPWTSGKVGVRQCVGRNIHWDNFTAVSYLTGLLMSYDDFFPFGQVMDGRSGVIGNPDTRYKYTGKERDYETGYDYFGARYYDARVGRFLSADPLEDRFPKWSPYAYSYDNPITFNDPTGMEGARTTEEQEENKNTDEDKRKEQSESRLLANQTAGASSTSVASKRPSGLGQIVDGVTQVPLVQPAIILADELIDSHTGGLEGSYSALVTVSVNTNRGQSTATVSADGFTALANQPEGEGGKVLFFGQCSLIVDGNATATSTLTPLADQAIKNPRYIGTARFDLPQTGNLQVGVEIGYGYRQEHGTSYPIPPTLNGTINLERK